MNKTLHLVLGISLLVIAAGAALWIYSAFSGGPASTTATSTPIGLPVAGPVPVGTYTSAGSTVVIAPSTMALATAGGGTVVVKDFIHNGVTVEDPSNPGQYYLAGPLGYCATLGGCNIASTTDFTIIYYPDSGFFNIGLNTEPLGAVRSETEQFLESTLGLSAPQLCSLQYYIGTTVSINSLYSGKNLGFDGCYQATQLP